MPSWAEHDPERFWDAADLYERVNGRLYVSADFALPRDLSFNEQVELARDFARELTDEEHLPYTLAIHAGRDEAGHAHNPHAHLMFSERRNDGIERSRQAWLQDLVESPTYRTNLEQRLNAGKLAPAMEELVWHFGVRQTKGHVGDSAVRDEDGRRAQGDGPRRTPAGVDSRDPARDRGTAARCRRAGKAAVSHSRVRSVCTARPMPWPTPGSRKFLAAGRDRRCLLRDLIAVVKETISRPRSRHAVERTRG